MKKSTNLDQLINAEIEKLHLKGSNDYQTLLRQVERKKRRLILNIPQMAVMLSTVEVLIGEWGRGTGKTTVHGGRISKILEEMPRSVGLLIGPSYQKILTQIVPSFVQGLEMFGLYKNLHYFIGKKPPRSWRNTWGTAYQEPEKFEHFITFYNGVGIHLISHDLKDDGRGLNSDWIIADEAALLDPNKLQENTNPTNRGTNTRALKHSKLFGSKFYTSSTPLTPEGEWFVKYEDLALQDPDKINFIKATCEFNKRNLREGFLENAEKEAYAQWVFDAEYKNIRPKFGKNKFYTLLDPDIHCYTNYDYTYYHTVGQTADCRGDGDLKKGVPLILGLDWGSEINCLTVNQHLKSLNEYRTIKSMHVLGEEMKIQDDLFDDFHKYYYPHQSTCKDLFLWYDNSGNNRTGNTRVTRAQQARKQLESKGWKVRLLTIGGRNPLHERKYLTWNMVLREDAQRDNRFPHYRINKDNARTAYVSMKNAKTKPGKNGEIKKDKSSESSKKIPRFEATDPSDANDAPMYGLFNQLLRSLGASLPPAAITSN